MEKKKQGLILGPMTGLVIPLARVLDRYGRVDIQQQKVAPGFQDIGR